MLRLVVVPTLVALALVASLLAGESAAQHVPDGTFIRAVVFRCMPDGPACQATYECSSGGPCDKHPNPVEPVAFNLQNLRTVTWWGWTGDARDATLHFDIVVGP